MSDLERARELIRESQGSKYIFGAGVLGQVGQVSADLGKKAALIYDVFPGNEPFLKTIRDSLTKGWGPGCQGDTGGKTERPS